jgi:hypothetical protein
MLHYVLHLYIKISKSFKHSSCIVYEHVKYTLHYIFIT